MTAPYTADSEGMRAPCESRFLPEIIMDRVNQPLPSHSLPAGATFQQPLLPTPRRVTLEDPAYEVMTDFRTIRAITVAATVSVGHASQRMRANRVHLLLVVDEQNTILGLITSTDIESERPLVAMHRLGVRRDELVVSDIMTPRDRIEVIEMADVRRAQVGRVVATLNAVGRQHALVIDRDDSGRPIVRGLFAVSQLNAQLGASFHPLEIARSFAEVETALAH